MADKVGENGAAEKLVQPGAGEPAGEDRRQPEVGDSPQPCAVQPEQNAVQPEQNALQPEQNALQPEQNAVQPEAQNVEQLQSKNADQPEQQNVNVPEKQAAEEKADQPAVDQNANQSMANEDHPMEEGHAEGEPEPMEAEMQPLNGDQDGEMDDVILIDAQEETQSTLMGEFDAEDHTKANRNAKFPTTLDGFGYHFDKDGRLKDKTTQEGFVFKVENSHSYNQRRYEALGELITEHVYELLEKEAHLQRIYIPLKAKENEPRSFVYKSEDLETNKEKLMVLIHGSGVVRAGQWARSLIINDCLDSGTQLPYIKKAREQGYAVLVLNTNLNIDENDEIIHGSGTPEEHAHYVWKHIIEKLPVKHIAIVAHSYGGRVTMFLVDNFYEDFKERVFAVAFTDSVHLIHDVEKKAAADYMRKYAKNWVSSKQPLDEEIKQYPDYDDVPQVSAGHPKHEYTSWSSFTSIFKYFEEKLKDKNEKDEL